MRQLVRTMLLVALLAGIVVGQEETPPVTPPDTGAAIDVSAGSPPAPVTDLTAKDSPDDHGHSITLTWTPSADDGAGANSVTMYLVRHAHSAEGPFDSVGAAPAGSRSYQHQGSREPESADHLADHTDYWYRVDALTADPSVSTPSAEIGPIQSYGQWFNSGRIPVLVAVLIFALFTIWFVWHAKRGTHLYVRPLGGIEAVDDAIGRATEMGKPILYVIGLGTASDIATIASFTVLGRVAKRVAEYQTELIVPCYDPIVMTVAQETVKSAYLDAGRPDDYKEDMVYFLTNSQFGYVGAVNGVMLRQHPATNVYMGKFYAESLILAETGALAGAIQIAGTDEVAQIPFFVVACDYTLIGEELFAASAYLGREPLLLGSLKAQDYAKAAVIVLGLTVSALLNIQGGESWATTIKSFFKVAN